ncbi:acyl-CoA thioester hydrolase [Lutibacter sp. Hel_I_33_5]|uniref:acyl-CoA thioesterase n=1 Tax=Lutibacter sp. Hel_I_33_5 TaxID=1566289 RepID=UPI0011A59A29|nr:thioesterase family protein [Lutibacter sp. Hel_I_33_5]TVZ55021.1 acyl-CoA thioester hydrolase [Lutibacter sp. Hel_I_33_5]
MNSVFTTTRKVTSKEIDDLNHVNNVVYIKWMDEVAFQHWSFLTKDSPFPEYVWVVIRHEVDYLKQALLDHEITIKTWVGESKGFKSERHMEFYLNEVLIVKTLTIWGMLDASNYKPVRITEKVLNVLQPNK